MAVRDRVRSRALPLAVAALLLVGCAGNAGGDGAIGTPVGSGRAPGSSPGSMVANGRYAPSFTPAPCDGPLFATRLPKERAGIVCGMLTVPENRDRPDGRRVVSPVAVLKATAPDPRPDPVVYVSGGPGDGALEALGAFAESGRLAEHDVVFLDQRGTGGSTPSLDCPEVADMAFDLAEQTDDPGTENARMSKAYAGCHDRLAGEADLDQYDSPSMADDIEDLRIAMKAPPWNLFAISYGTDPALAVLRLHPDGVRSVLLDSVVAPSSRTSPLAGSADGVLTNIVAGCRASATCDAAHPHLREDALSVRDRLNATPHRVSYTDPTGAAHVANLTGDDVIRGLFQAQYDTKLIPLLPQFIGALATGNDGLIDAVAPSLLGATGSGSEGAGVTVLCADRQQIDTPLDPNVRTQMPLTGPLHLAPQVPEICATWKVAPIDATFHSVQRTDVPVLVFGGEYDPATPAAESGAVAGMLGPKATFVEFPGLGHVATSADKQCPLGIYAAFLANPSTAPDISCAAAMPHPAWG